MEPQLEPIKVPRSLFWDLKLKMGRFNSAKDLEEWEDEEGISSGIGSSEYEQDSPPDLNNQERPRTIVRVVNNRVTGAGRDKEREAGRDDLDEGVYCTSESDDQDLPHQLKDAMMMDIIDDSCSNYSTETAPPGDEQHFNEFTEALRQQASKQNMKSVNGIPFVSPIPPPVLKVPQPGEMKLPNSSTSGGQTLTGLNNFNTASININMVPVIAPLSTASNVPLNRTNVAPVVTFPVLNWPYRPVQCYQTMSHQVMPTTTSGWTGKPPPGLLYSEIVPPVFKKAIDIAAGAPSQVPVDMTNKAPGYLPLPRPPQPVYPLGSLIKTNEQHEELQHWMSQQQSQQKFDMNMICEICEDRATGLHYGIVTCEGCKGFFKRTVQNKRIYTCIGEAKCEVTKALRNRCQFCRFKKCIQKGMILAAVREDRMPGGRNNGSMYRNIYRVKYKRRKRYSLPVAGPFGGPGSISSSSSHCSASPSRPKSNPLEETLRQNCRNSMLPSIGEREKPEVSERVEELAESARVVQKLLECEAKQNIGDLNFSLSSQDNVAQVLAQLGDDIVSQLVDWTQKLPYYDRLPLPLHTELLTSKWHELVVLSMVVHISRNQPSCSLPSSNQNEAVKETANHYLERIHHFMRNMLHKSVTMDELREEIGEVINKMTFILSILQNLGVSQEEYVCLKVLVLLSQGEGETNASLMKIQDLYLAALDHLITQRYPRQWSRLGQLLLLIPQISSVAAHLLKNRMIYVPFLLNNNLTH